MKDYHFNISTRSIVDSEHIVYPISYVLNYDRLSIKQLHYTLPISSNEEPKSYNKAAKIPEWQEAI